MSKTKVEPKDGDGAKPGPYAGTLNHQAGDVIAHISWAKVNRTSPMGSVLYLHDLHGDFEFEIHGTALISQVQSADRYHTEEKVNKTKAAEILVSSYNTPFTVVFDKDDGTERKLRGRLIHPEPLLGRSMVHDFDADGPRLVDHRTIKSLTVNGVKYTVK